MQKEKVSIHFIHDDELFFKQVSAHVPVVGDEIRLGGEGSEKYYTVNHRVWVYDEPECPFSRVNVGVSLVP